MCFTGTRRRDGTEPERQDSCLLLKCVRPASEKEMERQKEERKEPRQSET